MASGISRVLYDSMSEPENAFSAPLIEELAPLFPKYQILSLIATGGMGAVYHAVQTVLEREVAIKILPVEFGKDPAFCEGFVAEAKAMARLNHPNLISVHDFGEVNGMLFNVMEYVPGHSLHDACNGSALDPMEVIRLMTGICQGLSHAHQHGILHRDIKPANILLDARLQPKIGDFGLARPLDLQIEEGEAIYGTPGYTAPEVLAPPHTMDQRADIFSLGILLHELLTGLLPESDPRPPSVIAQCDPRFDAVVRKAAHPNPQERYQSAAEIADDLQKIASTAGPKVLRTVAPATATQAVGSYSTQPAKKGGGGLLVILPLVAGLVAVLFFRDRIFQKADPAPAPAPVVESVPEPIKPDPVVADPEPVEPGPEVVVVDPEPVEPGPEVVAVDPEPVEPGPEAVAVDPEPVEPEPVVAVSDPMPEPVAPPQPKFDVEGFFAHARSVMVKRCAPEIAKRDALLAKNVTDFRDDARRLSMTNLDEQYHAGFESEVHDFVSQRQVAGNRMGEGLERPLKFKSWLVDLHKEHKAREILIDGQMLQGLAEHQKTYLHGLGLRVKALQEDDPVAAEMIQAEIDKVIASPDYFAGLMVEAIRNE
jgi:hypothetical protein